MLAVASSDKAQGHRTAEKKKIPHDCLVGFRFWIQGISRDNVETLRQFWNREAVEKLSGNSGWL
jgi:hypothetical protein